MLIAFGVTWLGWIPGLLIGSEAGYIMPNFDTYPTLIEEGFVNSQHIWLGIAFSLAVFGPLLGALVATWMDAGGAGLADLWRRITKWRVDSIWYLRVLLISLLLPAVPVAFFALSGGLAENAFAALPLSYVLFIFAAQVLTSGLGEEPGWRGFLLPRLQARYQGEKPVWYLGLIWAVWHYPLVVIQTMSMMQDVTPAQIIVTIISSLAGQTMSLIGLTYLYVWLYNQTRSVFLSILFHALGNLSVFWFTSLLDQPQSATLLIALMPWVIVVVLQRIMGKARFPGQPA